MIRNILLDRDGTVIEEQHYLHDPEQVRLLPGAAQALKNMQQAGLELFLVTNQSGIGRGYFSLKDFQAVQDRLSQLLIPHGVTFRAVAFCPHAPQDHCTCRKPEPGLWKNLAAKFDLKPEESLMLGDKLVDILFARNAQLAKAILLLTGHGAKQAQEYHLPLEPQKKWIEPATPDNKQGKQYPDLIAKDLESAWEWIQTRPGMIPDYC